MFKYGWDEKFLQNKRCFEENGMVVYWPSGKIEFWEHTVPIEILEKFIRKAYSWLAARRMWEKTYGKKN